MPALSPFFAAFVVGEDDIAFMFTIQALLLFWDPKDFCVKNVMFSNNGMFSTLYTWFFQIKN